ncbi:unnamed protein product [Clonostachys rhizophaga]|uniref:Nucleoside phosphorylase domain-containing protein n=1 Tax=Clonostachys rhizophaga TaxID=160324 RepID=A0A9N9YPV6_9HYPO|nr:unnamed protein product [Clonostachys rhizophaga]
MSNREDYTVGWICAIVKEYVAAQVFLDERYSGPDSVACNDTNTYTLGRMGRHKVVIAVLPDGEYGISAATGVAKDMLHSFPNVRIGLMVGIGGGAPSRKHDIRLGDIVVSASHGSSGGVFQYDFGKTIQDQKFCTTGFLNQPPTLLRCAVADIRAKFEIEGHQIEAAIEAILENKPTLRKNEVVHPVADDEACVTTCGDGPPTLIARPKRTDEDENPTIHYGLIASANQLMKDALFRDQLAKEKDVLCFEMEAAGLMNQFPCLVIRGICDYSDTHKNKEWQGYAAMTAAAYAKDLLCCIPPTKVEAEKKIKDILSDIGTSIRNIDSKLSRKEDLEILKWLSSTDYDAEQNDHFRQRQENTGQWFINSSEFRNWIEAIGQTLFCPGIPGAGKTIMVSAVIDHLKTRFSEDESAGISFIYFNFRRQGQKVQDLFSSLLMQLSRGRPALPDSLQTLYRKHQTKCTRPRIDEILETFQSIISTYAKVFIVVDALDEYQSSDGYLDTFLTNIFKIQDKTQLNILATSRHVAEIAARFHGGSLLEIRAVNQDVRTYLAGHMDRLPNFVRRDADLQNRIRSTIAQAVNGMFLLASLHIDTLTREPTVGHLELALHALPKGLDETYEQALVRIERQGGGLQQLAKAVLSWLVFAHRQLSPAELQCALAIKPGSSKLDRKFVPDVETIGSICAGLVTLDTESNVIRLVHMTAQAFFERTHDRWLPNAENDVTRACITYLFFDEFKKGPCLSNDEYDERLKSNLLYPYAIEHCIYSSQDSTDFHEETIMFLQSKASLEAAIQTHMVGDIIPFSSFKRAYRNYSQKFPKGVSMLHVAAHCGIKKAVETLILSGAEPSAKDDSNRTPLLYAATRGYETVVKQLLDADPTGVDLMSIHGRTPISHAAQLGRAGVVRLLLDTGKAKADLGDKIGRTPLSYAAKEGNGDVVKLLLETGDVNPDSEDEKGRSPLSYAARYGHGDIVKLLLETGDVDPDSKDENGRSPLSYAAWFGHGKFGHANIVKLLLETDDVNPDSKDKHGRSPLSYAAEEGSEATIKLLLDVSSTDVNSRNIDDMRTLSYAAKHGHESIVRTLFDRWNRDARAATDWPAEWFHSRILRPNIVDILLENGKLDIVSENGRSPLFWAARAGAKTIVERLLNSGKVNINSKDIFFGRTLLSWAIEGGEEEIIKLLLDVPNIDVNLQGSDGESPLITAVFLGREAITKILLNIESVEVDLKESTSSMTAFGYAAMTGNEAIMRLLLDTGMVDINTKVYSGLTPLHFAAIGDQEASVRLLLDTGKADVESRDCDGLTPLALAAQEGREGPVKLLLDRGKAYVNSRGENDKTPIIAAAERRHEGVVKLLLDTDGLDIDVKDSSGLTALDYATKNWHEPVRKLLQARLGSQDSC